MNFTVITPVNHDYFSAFLERSAENITSFGLLIEGVACGAVQFSIAGQTATLIHMEIAPGYRRQGGGTFLLRKSRQHLFSCGIVQLLCHPDYLPWDNRYYLNFFLTHCGFQNQGEIAWIYTMALSDLSKRFTAKSNEPSIVPLTHFPKEQWGALVQTMPPARQTLTLSHPDFLPHLSMVVIEQKKMAGFLMVHQKGPLLIEVAGLCYTGSDTTILGRLLSTATTQAVAEMPASTMVTAMVYNPQVASTLDRIFTTVRHTKCPVHQFVCSKEVPA